MPKPKDEVQSLTAPTPIKPLPNQLPLPFDREEAHRQPALFDAGRDLPGAAERDQQIFWDLPRG
jgi:hypothetical protein